jgi:hypothetical protein
MPKPENVNPSNFKVLKILFNNDSFSIAYGIWRKKRKSFSNEMEWR